MLREGCDGKPGSMAKLDACNECGGKRACVGCDGVPFSGKHKFKPFYDRTFVLENIFF